MTNLSDSDDGTVQEPNRAVTERAERLREAVKLAGGTTAVATRIGMHVGTLNRYAAGRDMKAENMIALARGTGVRLEWLATGRGPIHEGAMASPSHSADAALQQAPGTVTIDRYDARAAAGKASLVPDGKVIERIQFNEEWVRVKLRRRPENLALLEAWGDSMEPTIGDGDVLMIDHTINDVVSGRLYVLDIAGELLVKRIQRRLNGAFLVQSDNPRYPAEEVRPDEAHGMRIIGEVVWSGRII